MNREVRDMSLNDALEVAMNLSDNYTQFMSQSDIDTLDKAIQYLMFSNTPVGNTHFRHARKISALALKYLKGYSGSGKQRADKQKRAKNKKLIKI